DLPYVVVITTYPGASPEKVELEVTKPLEKALATTSGIENIDSVSSENSSMIILEFSQDMNMDSAMIDLSGKIDLAKSQLDDKVGSPMLMKLNPDMMPIMVASVDIDGLDIKSVSKYVEDEVIPEFERIDGIASVDTMGILEESIGVILDSDKIDAINNKVLNSIDSELANAKSKLDSAKAKIKEGKDVLAKESASKTEEIIDGGIVLEEGKNQIKEAINNLPQLQKELEAQRKDLLTKRDTLLWAVEQQNQEGIEITEEQKQALSQLEEGISSIDKGIDDIKNQKPTLENSLKEIIENQKKLEVGKLTLNQELTKVSVNLSNSEAQLDESIKNFEESRDEAYKNANVSGMITKDTISNILMAQNFSMPAGYISQDGNEYIVKVGDKIKDVKELENLVLFNIDVEGIGEIRLKEVAKVEMIDNSDEMYAKINGNDGIILTFQKQSTSSTSEVSDKINETIKTLTTENKDMHVTALQDQGVYIDLVVNSVLNNLILGGILAVIILFVFLKSIKPTIIIAFSIPISLLFAITLMYFSGVTLNMISLSGLALGVGMLVDNSIVVI
ncbi:MAG: efflux RND transporter permease subunit, partial [Peptostreptococcaceae bacterium]